MTRLIVDAGQIREFVQALFAYASDSTIISLRTFDDGGSDRPLRTRAVRLNGGGLESLIQAAAEQAQFAADHSRKANFCPPLAGFSDPVKADEAHVAEGYTLSVECDRKPQQARQKLETLLGRATFVVESGGLWTDPETGELQPKCHLHWRLNEPARDGDRARLKEARRLATALVGGDASNVPVTHPIRWPGSWHRKGEPKLARIVARSANEIGLDDDIEALRLAAPEAAAKAPVAAEGERTRENNRETAELIRRILSGEEYHTAIVPLAARLIGQGMMPGAVVTHIRDLMEQTPPANRDWRWQRRYDSDVPQAVTSAQKKYGAKEDTGEPLFDPWSDYIVPSFPLDVLPPIVQRFVGDQSKVIGGDVSALAMLALSAMGGALDHRFRLKLLGNGNWYASPRLWVLLVGGVSFKKTPTINAALAPLEEYQNEIRREYQAGLRDYEAALGTYDKKSGEPPPEEPTKPPRFVVSDTTIEKLGELLARKPRGVLVKRDELAGWIGAMEKYGGRGAAASDRAFWLQSYDGGPHTIDRISRGELWVENLSASVVGGIQPDRLAELTGLTTDGLLQRFIPVMMQAPAFPIDVDVSASAEGYRRLIRRMIAADPCSLALADDAKLVMEELRRHVHELEQASAGLARGFQGFIGKLPGMAGSLALMLHLAENPHEQRMHPVSRRVAEKVQRLVLEFVIPHAFEFYRTSETTTDGDRLQRLASWIVTSGKARITARDLTHNVRDMRGVGLRDVQLRVSPLVASGWITPVATGPENRAWDVSPAVARQFKARAEEEERRKTILAKLMASPRRPRQEAEW
ncbi:MAG: hypothetical protein K0Q60_3503 [Microvirga sp.]|nr:hypothetical protein [Microvirga sp.]